MKKLLPLCLLLISASRSVTHPYLYEHEDPYTYEIQDLEETYQRYTRKAQEYHEKAEALYTEPPDSAHLDLTAEERRQRKAHYEMLAGVYEKRARRSAVQLKRLYARERKRQAEERDIRDINRLLYLQSQRPLEPRELRRLEDLQQRINRRRDKSWR